LEGRGGGFFLFAVADLELFLLVWEGICLGGSGAQSKSKKKSKTSQEYLQEPKRVDQKKKKKN
jgi:hypothetical protein